MKKTILGLLVFSFLILLAQNISAYHVDGTEVVISANDGVYARDYAYVDSYNGYPQYRVYVDDDYDLSVSEYRYGNPSNYYNSYQPAYNPNLYGAYNNYNTRYNQNIYGVYRDSNSRYYYLNKNNIKKYLTRSQISAFIDRSAYSRYDLLYGQDSQVFCDTQDCQEKDPNPTNFRYKHTYDPRIEGTGSYQNYYYQPQKDPQTGAYNWRY